MIVNNVSYEIKPGMLCIFQPYQLHHLKLEYDDNQCFERSIAIFEPTMYSAYFERWPSLHSFYRFICEGELPFPCLYDIDEPVLDSLFQSTHIRLQTLSDKEQFEESSLFLVMLFRMLRQCWKDRAPAYQTRRRPHQVEHILRWIESNYAAPFRLDDMAKSLHLSPYHLSHLFKEETGISISDYIATRRIHQAVLLLTTTKKPISLIAEQIGFKNSSYFCKLFKSHIGTTPHQYRKNWSSF